MPIGRSVHVGVNKAKPKFHVSELKGCRKDAQAMFDIAVHKGFEAKPPFFDELATFDAVDRAIREAADALKKDDIFLFTFAGHGSFNPTVSADDGQDELILLHDCLLIDNFVRRNWWSRFKPGVRILGIADCCHSGTVLQASLPPLPMEITADVAAVIGDGMAIAASSVNVRLRAPTRRERRTVGPINRGLTREERDAIVNADSAIHAKLRAALRVPPDDKLKGTLLTFAACRDRELARDGLDNGAFTARLKEVWNNDEFKGDYCQFITDIQTTFDVPDSTQHPMIQDADATEEFLKQIPFTI